MSIAQNTALFSILGTTYGGNGQTTFALPDLRSRVPIHAGQGPGLSLYVLGQVGGTETNALTNANLPAIPLPPLTVHANADPTSSKPNNRYPASLSQGISYADTSDGTTMNAGVITGGPIGGNSAPLNNVQPYAVVNFIIALEGIFPSRN